MFKESYARTQDILKTGERPVTTVSLKLRDGTELQNIIPYTIIERKIGFKKFLKLYYLTEKGEAQNVHVGKIEGLSVTKGKGEYKGKLLVNFTYFKTQDGKNFKEEKTRAILVHDLYHGVQGAHIELGESPDTYFFSEDTQYVHKPKDERTRNFPLWRTGVCGESAEVQENFRK